MTLSQSILATLAYHDIFNYPLTKEEIRTYLIGKKSSPKMFEKEIQKLKSFGQLGERQGYFFLKKQSKLVSIRKTRERYSKAKLKKAVFYSKLLKTIPTIKLVAISGALAMNNSQKGDDIDLVIITAENTLWTTRFLANVILFLFKRKPSLNRPITHYQSPVTNNKACLNLFLDESDLKITPKNLYMAHEICQMKPLWDRDKTYSRLINSNRWIYKYLPNWQPEKPLQRHPRASEDLKWGSALVLKHLALVARPLEALAKWGQLWYMRPKITTEKIGAHQLFFHPKGTQESVLKEHKKKLQKLNLVNY